MNIMSIFCICIGNTTIIISKHRARSLDQLINIINDFFLVLTILTCCLVCLLIVVCSKAGSGAPWRP